MCNRFKVLFYHCAVTTLSKKLIQVRVVLAYAIIGFFFGVMAYVTLDTFQLSYIVEITRAPWLVTGVLGALSYLVINLVLSYLPPSSSSTFLPRLQKKLPAEISENREALE